MSRRVPLTFTARDLDTLAVMSKLLADPHSEVADDARNCRYRLIRFDDDRLALEILPNDPAPTSGPTRIPIARTLFIADPSVE